MKIIIIKKSNGIHEHITTSFEDCDKADLTFIQDIMELIHTYNEEYLKNA